MGIRPEARPHFQIAKDRYQQKQWREAAESCDRTVALGFRDLVVYDLWAASLGKLIEPEDETWRQKGFDLIKTMCDRWPEDWRPHYRKADYLLSQRLLTPALNAIDASLGLVSEAKRPVVERKRTEILGRLETATILREHKLGAATRTEKAAILSQRRKEANRYKDFTYLLSDDLFLAVVDHLLVDDPNIACRLSAVKRDWRDALRSVKKPWQTLWLGAKGTVEKTKVFMERSGGLKSLRLLPSFKLENSARIGKLLQDQVGEVRSFEYARTPDEMMYYFRDKMDSLEHLRQNDHSQVTVPVGKMVETEFHCGLMLTNATLRTLEIKDARLLLFVSPWRSSQATSSRSSRFERSHPYLANLESLQLSGCQINTSYQGLHTLARTMPKLCRLGLDRCEWKFAPCQPEDTSSASPTNTQTPKESDRIDFESLTHYSDINTAADGSPLSDNIYWTHVRAPKMLHLDLWRTAGSLHDIIRMSTWAQNLPKLQSLDIGHAVTPQADLLELLPQLESLKFLNVSYCALDDGFLKALTIRPSKAPTQGQVDNDAASSNTQSEPLLPNIIALSIAGLNITSIPLRDFVMSRLPSTSKSATPITTKPRRSIFGPRSSQVSSPTPQLAKSSTSQPGPSVTTSTRADGDAPPPLPVARMRWLCIDGIEGIDAALPLYLAKKMPFVSWQFRSSGKQSEDRVRGRGRYAWDQKYYDSCTDGEGQGCQLVRVPGTTDSYQVHHTCRQYNHIAGRAKESEDINIWESQWDPSSSPSAPSQLSKSSAEGGDDTTTTPGWTETKHPGQPSGSGVKRQGEGSQTASGCVSKKVKGKAKISIGADGHLTGF